MSTLRWVKHAAIALACCGMLAPQCQLLASAPQAQSASLPLVQDVELAAGGTLTGHLVDGQGIGTEGASISIRTDDRELAQAVTDANGRYVVRNMRGGVYQIVAGQSRQFVRVWAPNTAPPSARDTALVVSAAEPVRSQSYGYSGLDAATFLVATGALVVSIITLAKVDDNEDTVVTIQTDVNDLQDDVDEVLQAVSP